MTMLMQWMVMAAVIFGPWLAIFMNGYETPWIAENKTMLFVYPLVLVAAFGVYSATVILFRVYNFNDCKEAEAELKESRPAEPHKPPIVKASTASSQDGRQERCVSVTGAGDSRRGAAARDALEPSTLLPLPRYQHPTDLDATDPAGYRVRAATLLSSICLDTEKSRRALFKRTRHDHAEWLAARRGRITASNFQRIANMRNSTSCHSTIESLLYGVYQDLDTAAMKYGRECEEKAVLAYERERGVAVQRPVGLIVHPRYGFIAATPDGVISNRHLLEVKCPFRAKHESIDDIVSKDKTFFLDSDLRLKRNHTYYAQVQCQLACASAATCDFYVWSPQGAVCERIVFDPAYWQERLDKVQQFYFQCLLPEMVDSRKARGLPFRERASFVAKE